MTAAEPGKFTLGRLIATLEWLHQETGQDSYTEQEITELVLSAVRDMRGWHCFSCGENTLELAEYYVVQPDLWRTYGVEGMLCIGCLEIRLGRKLIPADFMDVEVNKPFYGGGHKSERLRDRLGLVLFPAANGQEQYALNLGADS